MSDLVFWFGVYIFRSTPEAVLVEFSFSGGGFVWSFPILAVLVLRVMGGGGCCLFFFLFWFPGETSFPWGGLAGPRFIVESARPASEGWPPGGLWVFCVGPFLSG